MLNTLHQNPWFLPLRGAPLRETTSISDLLIWVPQQGHLPDGPQGWIGRKLNTSCWRTYFLSGEAVEDVRAHCYCACLVRTLFIRHVRTTSCISSARTRVETQQNLELMTFALTWCANFFVGCSVNQLLFSGRSLPFLTVSIILKKSCTWEVLIISHIRVELVHGYRCAWLRSTSCNF